MRACPHCLSVYSVDAEHCSVDGKKTGGPQALRGKSIEGYVFDELLGVGGTGCVFKGHASDGRPCAIKLLFREMAADESLIERFRREAEAVTKMDHKNVVKIYGYGATKTGTVFIAMEFLEGKTLKDVLEAEAPLRAVRAGRIAEQMASGLGEAHRLGFVHRDLKPGNIMICRDELGRERVKLLDFGIVASLKERENDDRLTKTGYIVGTPTYMAPEQIDPKAVGPQVDVYAIGVMLYEMLCGSPPFRGTLEQILVAKMTEDPTPIEGGGELGELALRFLEKDQDKRPQNALQASAQLGRLSFLSEDPATVRAEMPDLPPYELVGAAPPTVRTEENEPVTGWSTDTTKPSPAAEGDDKWTADTRRINFESPPPVDFVRPSIAADTVLSAESRPDTLIDGIPAAMQEGSHSIPPLRASNPVIVAKDLPIEKNDPGVDIPTDVTMPPDDGLDRDTDEDMVVPSVGPTLKDGDIPPFGSLDADSGVPTSEDQPVDPELMEEEQTLAGADSDPTFERFDGDLPADDPGDEETHLQAIIDPATHPPQEAADTIGQEPPVKKGLLSVRVIALSVVVISLFMIAAILAFKFVTAETVIIDVPK